MKREEPREEKVRQEEEEEEDCTGKIAIKWPQRTGLDWTVLTEIAATASAVHSLFCFAS